MIQKQIKSFLKDYFTLTSRERKGALSLSLIIILQIIIIIRMNYFSSGEPDIDKFQPKIIAFEKNVEIKK
jgi:hypothetical protein